MVMMRAVPAAARQTQQQREIQPGAAVPGLRRSSGRAAGRAARAGRVEHTPEWRAPAPVWDRALADPDPAAIYRPVVLRFDRDEFMDDFLALLESSPEALPGYVAQPETWRDEQAGWLPSDHPRWSQMAYKLYQPAHQRHYLVAADLVCRIPGLPCRTVDRAKDERVFFVLRRLAPRSPEGAVNPADPATYVEEAWLGPERGWVPLTDPTRLGSAGSDVEERHPLFGVFFQMAGQKRRVLAGLIPVSSRDSYEAKGASSPYVDPGTSPQEPDPRLSQFLSQVDRPLRDLIRSRSSEEEAAEASTFILYDFAKLLHDHFGPVWEMVEREAGSGRGLDSPEGSIEELADWLLTRPIDHEGTKWAEGLVTVWRQREALLSGDPAAPSYTIAVDEGHVNTLRERVEAAIGSLGAYRRPAQPEEGAGVPTLPKMDAEAGAYYVVRCVYERPRCGPLHPPLLSEACRPFQIASFFDPDAPTRPVRISLPVDTSVAGLRKFKRDVSFFASKQLRSQLERLRGANFGDLDSGPPGGRPFDLGMVCTLSIPIITICATVLLMIILQVLNFVFWWLPFCKICFPIRR